MNLKRLSKYFTLTTLSVAMAALSSMLLLVQAHANGSNTSGDLTDPKMRGALCAESLIGPFSSDEDATELVNKLFNGTVPFPTDMQISFSNTEDGREMTVGIGKISDLDTNFQAVIALLKRESLANPSMPFREYGGFYFQYENKSDSFISFTSELPTRIELDVHMKAIEQSTILDTLEHNPKEVGTILHFHTHPGIELRKGSNKDRADVALLPNWGDFGAYQYFASLFAYHAKQEVPFIGIVIPMCELCDDIYFEVSVQPDQKMIKQIEFNKQIEAIGRALDALK